MLKAPDANYEYWPGTLKTEILVNGKVVQAAQSSARDAYLSVDWSPS
jgi:hypothetical protein